MKRIAVLIGFILVGFCTNAISQKTHIDTLLRQNELYTKEDSNKVKLLIEISREYRKLKLTKERFQIIESAISIGEKIKFYPPLPALYNSFALYYEGRSEFENSIIKYTRAIELCELLGDKENAAGYTMNFGTVYHTLADFPRALTLYQKAANYYISAGMEDDAANCYINIGGVYNEFTDQHEKALEYINKSLHIFQKMGDEGRRGVTEAYQSIVATYLAASEDELRRMKINPADRFAIVRQNLSKAMDIAKQVKEADLEAEVITKIGEVDEKELKLASALSQYQSALAIYQRLEKKYYVFTETLNVGRILQKQKDLINSLNYLHTALTGARQLKIPDLQKEALLLISDIHEKQYQFDSAYHYYKQFVIMRDSVSNTEKQKEITRKQLQFEFGIKEREYQLGQQVADARIKEQEGLTIRQQQEISLRKKQLELTQREKEIEKLNYLQKQSELEAASRLKNSQLQEKELQRKLDARVSDEKISEQQLQIKFNQKLIMFLILALLVLSVAAVFVVRARQKTMKLNNLVFAQKDELEEMGKVKDKIFSIVSHDMRAPVNNLMAFSSILEEGEIEQNKLALYIDQIKGTLDHTSTMMENLLNWASSQMQGFTPVIKDVDLLEIMNVVIESIQPFLLKKDIALINTIQSGITVKADKNMLELILRNLLSNAIKFTSSGGKIELFINKIQDGKTAIAIRDNGVSISAQKVALINATSVLSLESTAGTNKEKGTGLGLMLCKHFAILMKGNISVESREGFGSVFVLNLPGLPV